MQTERKVNANPTKEFFVNMIVKDILLKQAVIELIDNSIDGAKAMKETDYNGRIIDVSFDEKEFRIKDNCSGIPIDVAENYAFRFGRPKGKESTDQETTGIFGIGMKRALFKMGKYFKISSRTKDESFEIELDVDQWVDEQYEKWDFPFADYHENENNSETGTEIVVKRMNEEIRKELADPQFEKELILHIERRVGLAISYGLSITVNGKSLKGNNVELVEGEGAGPIVKEYFDEEIKVKLVVGVAPRNGPKYLPENAGWYIYCNERLVVAADKSSLTTWKDMENKSSGISFHNDYASFRGIVYFNSLKPEKLPWNTTKTGIDETSQYYLRAREKMMEMFKAIKSFLDEMRKNTEENDDGVEETVATKMKKIEMDAKKSKTIARSQSIISIDYIQVTTERNVTISYKKPKKEVERVKELLGIKSNKAVGEETFDYYLDAEG